MNQPIIRKELDGVCGSFLSIVDKLDWLPESLPNALAATKIEKGHVTLYLPRVWNELSLEVQRNMIIHEAGHWAGFHIDRVGERTAVVIGPKGETVSLMNLCNDAAIHEIGGVDWQLIDRTFKSESATYERLGVPVMPPVFAYDLLLKKAEAQGNLIRVGCSGCGSTRTSDDSPESEAKRMDGQLMAGETLAKAGVNPNQGYKGGDGVSPSRNAGIIPNLPAWMLEALSYMLNGGRNPMDLQRSWRRESRVSDCIPGRSRSIGKEARIFLDASGSITDEMIGQFLGALVATPELASSDVCVFDTSVSEPCPVSDVEAIQQEAKKRGGGTAIRHAASMRDEEKTNVWLTDAESGDGLPPPEPNDVWVVWGHMAAHLKGLGYNVIEVKESV